MATVDSNGKVTAISSGSAIITCTANDGSGVQATCDVTVKPDGIEINAANFPDENFRNYLLKQDYGKDGVPTDEEIKGITSLLSDELNISNLKGIEYFTSLDRLRCCDNNLTSLDVSKNTALVELWFHRNQVTSIDVSKNTELYLLSCFSNRLTSLDVSKNVKLTFLQCGSNQLSSLDVSKNVALTYLSCRGNQLTSLDVSNNTALTKLYCDNNQIKGTAMDNLISGLPQNTTSDIYYFLVIDPTNENEGNVCTTAQVAAVKAKGWFPCYYDSGTASYIEYEDSDKSAISSQIMQTDKSSSPVYSISGQQLTAPLKGVNIVGGRKVIIK